MGKTKCVADFMGSPAMNLIPAKVAKDGSGHRIEIARASGRIAVESVVAGIGLSVLGMIAAACGYLTPVQGALLQEAIDVAVILNALRALRIMPRELATPATVDAASRQTELSEAVTS